MKHLKDKKITIYEVVSASNENSMPVTKYRPIHPSGVWAYVRDMSTEERISAQLVGSKEEAVFAVNWRPDVKLPLCVAFRGQWYKVERIDAFEGYKSDLRLFVSSAWKPEEKDILPFEA